MPACCARSSRRAAPVAEFAAPFDVSGIPSAVAVPTTVIGFDTAVVPFAAATPLVAAVETPPTVSVALAGADRLADSRQVAAGRREQAVLAGARRGDRQVAAGLQLAADGRAARLVAGATAFVMTQADADS